MTVLRFAGGPFDHADRIFLLLSVDSELLVRAIGGGLSNLNRTVEVLSSLSVRGIGSVIVGVGIISPFPSTLTAVSVKGGAKADKPACCLSRALISTATAGLRTVAGMLRHLIADGSNDRRRSALVIVDVGGVLVDESAGGEPRLG